MRYKPHLTNEFERVLLKLAKKDKALVRQLKKKMDQILENPKHYPTKRYDLKGKQGAHVGSFVIIFEIKGDVVSFRSFKHHNHAY